jgi:hypothetical protein
MAARPLIELRQLCCSLHRCVLHKPAVGGGADALGSRALDRRCGPPGTGAGLALTAIMVSDCDRLTAWTVG